MTTHNNIVKSETDYRALAINGVRMDELKCTICGGFLDELCECPTCGGKEITPLSSELAACDCCHSKDSELTQLGSDYLCWDCLTYNTKC